MRKAAALVRPGQTILCEGYPSLVYRNDPLPSGRVALTFFTPNAGNIIQQIAEPWQSVTIAPLAPTGESCSTIIESTGSNASVI